MLLAGFWCSKTGEFGGVRRSYLIVGRGRREGVVNVFGLEAISAQDTGFFGVVSCEVVGEVGKVGGEAGSEVGGVASGNAGEVGGVGNSVGVGNAGVFSLLEIFFGFFACFSRTWS